jgi:hypothetical protein
MSDVKIPVDEYWVEGMRIHHKADYILADKFNALKADFDALAAKYASAIRTLQDIAAMGRTKGCESARHRLIELGEPE